MSLVLISLITSISLQTFKNIDNKYNNEYDIIDTAKDNTMKYQTLQSEYVYTPQYFIVTGKHRDWPVTIS